MRVEDRKEKNDITKPEIRLLLLRNENQKRHFFID